MAFELEAVVAGTLDQQQRACDLWQPNFNSSWPREALGMGTPTHFYKPSGTTYAGDKVQVLNFASQAGASAGGHVETPVDGERK